jgi:6,7-dimethyl-8-ribityllumazine synthase
MLQRMPRAGPRSSGARIAIVASEYNRRHVDGMLDGARRLLEESGAEVEVYRVPGAFEIPVTVSCLAAGSGTGRGPWSAILCLGVIIRGETAHADLVGTAVTGALMELSVRHRIPVVHEVLLVGNAAQADARCLDARHNRGAEAGRTALVMARLLGRIGRSGRDEEAGRGRRSNRSRKEA